MNGCEEEEINPEASAGSVVQFEDEAFDEGSWMRLPGDGDAVIFGAAFFGHHQRRCRTCTKSSSSLTNQPYNIT